jgi:hypothetical protein
MRILNSVVPACGLALIMAGCATAPQPATAPAAAPVAATAAAAPAALAAHAMPVNKLSAEEIVNLKRLGYKLVDSNGQTLYCSSDIKLGSHLQHDNVCMTEREMIAMRDETQRRLQNIMTQVAPKQGK